MLVEIAVNQNRIGPIAISCVRPPETKVHWFERLSIWNAVTVMYSDEKLLAVWNWFGVLSFCNLMEVPAHRLHRFNLLLYISDFQKITQVDFPIKISMKQKVHSN